LAYELSHVVQRSSRASAIQRAPENDDDHLSEWAAGAAADNVVRAVQTARARAGGAQATVTVPRAVHIRLVTIHGADPAKASTVGQRRRRC